MSSSASGWPVLDDGESKPAPGELRLVQAFVNTRDPYHDLEHLPDADSLRAWMRRAGLVESTVSALEEDFGSAIELRDALRELLAPDNSEKSAECNSRDVEALNRLTDSLPLKVGFGGDGRVRIARPASSVRGALGVLLGIVLYAEASGTWSRLRSCANPGCRWVFYDASKNRVGSWCRMSACGNQAKSRAHRERLKAADTGAFQASDP